MAINDITGDALKSKTATVEYSTGFDMIDWSAKDIEDAGLLLPNDQGEVSNGS